MMMIPDRDEIKELSTDELEKSKISLINYISDYDNNKIPQEEYYVKPSPETKYKLYKEYLNRISDELNNRNIKEKNDKDNNYAEVGENTFEFLSEEIEKLTKELADAYRNNDQELINKLQNKIKETTDRQLKKDIDKLVKEDLKREKEYISQKLDKDKINEQQILGKATYINREILLNRLGYLYNYKEKRKNYLTEKDFMLDELKTIKNELMSNDGVETPYIPCVRAQHCINEFIYYLERNQANDCLMDIYEVIESDKNMIYNDHFNKDYKYSSYIGNEEKSIILNMINRLEAHLNNSNNQYSTEKLFEKAKSDFNIFVENEYGTNKYLSLPLPVLHNKLKSLILLSAVEENAEIYNCGYVLIDTITRNIEYKLEPEHLLSNDPKLNLLNFIPKKEISINSKEEYNNLYSRYFNLLDDLILMYNSKEECISGMDKIEEFLNIYKNIVPEAEQVEYSLNNEFLSWCLISVPKQEIKKLDFGKTNAIIRETYIDENGLERDRGKNINITLFPIIDLSKIAENIYNEIEKLPQEAEFTIQQFLKDYEVEGKDKFTVCNFVFDLCENNNIVIVEKIPNVDLGLPWNILRIKKGNNNKELLDIINKKLEEFDNDTAANLKNYILEVIKRIIDLPNDYETAISKIINYNPERNFVDPLTQGIIYNKVNEICNEIGINLQSTYDSFGGLAFNYTFIKMKENEVYIKPQESNDEKNTNIDKEEEHSNLKICYICYYDFVPYKQIGPIKLNIDDINNYEEAGARNLNNHGMNNAVCKPLLIDSPAVVKRNKNVQDQIYIMYNGNKIKITCYFKTFVEDLEKICDDIKLVKIPDESCTLAISEQLGIIIRAEDVDNEFLIRFISFCGKDAFNNILENYNL